MCCSRTWHNEQVEVGVAPQQKQPAYNDEVRPDTLLVAHHQGKEWEYEVDNKVQEENIVPCPVQTLHVIRRFLRQVSVPDKQELGDPGIGPENTEPEHELTKVMEMVLVYPAHITGALQQGHDNN